MAKRRRFKCAKCDRKFSMAAHLARHMSTIHASKKIKATKPVATRVNRGVGNDLGAAAACPETRYGAMRHRSRRRIGRCASYPIWWNNLRTVLFRAGSRGAGGRE